MGVMTRVAAELPTPRGPFSCYAFGFEGVAEPQLALVRGNPAGRRGVLVRLHSECVTGDLFGSLRCDCGEQFAAALDRIGLEDCGVLVYLRGHEGRGIGIADKLKAYALQDDGLNTVEANLELGLPVDARRYELAASILHDLRIASVRLMTNNPRKVAELVEHDIDVQAREPLTVTPSDYNRAYLRTKRDRMGHLLELDD